MHNDYLDGKDDNRFLTKEDQAARLRDELAVDLARQVHEWSKDNLSRFDNDGNKRTNFAELDLGIRSSKNEDDGFALTYLQENYKQIEDQSQNRFLFIKGAGGVSIDGISEYVEKLEKQRERNEETLITALHERALQADSRSIVNGLMGTGDGNPNASLFRVIDSLDGDIDNELSKRDLNRYLEEYQKRARYGDIGTGFFTAQTRRYVEALKDNWDKPEMVRLRGTWTRRDHDGRDEEVPNSTISEKSLKKAIGVDKSGDMFAPFLQKTAEKRNSESTSANVVEEQAPKLVEKQETKPVEASAPKPVEKAVKPVEKETKPVEASAPKPVEKAAKPVEASVSKPVERQAAKPFEMQAPVLAEKPAAKSSKAESVPQVVEAAAANRLPYSPWKANPEAISNAVADRIMDDYMKAEQYFAKIDAATLAKDNDEYQKAVELNEWGKDNLRRFDTSGDDRLNFGELDLGIRTSRRQDRRMLKSIQNGFEALKEQSGGAFLFVDRPDAISQKDLRVNVEKKDETLQNNVKAQFAAVDQRAEQARNEVLASGLLATADGNPNQSLFRVIDGMDNDIDNEISRRDLGRYLDTYEKRSRYGDLGHGFFTSSTRNYVEELQKNWNSVDIKKMRGTYTDSQNREQTYDHIKLDRLKKMLGLGKNSDLFQYFSLEGR